MKYRREAERPKGLCLVPWSPESCGTPRCRVLRASCFRWQSEEGAGSGNGRLTGLWGRDEDWCLHCPVLSHRLRGNMAVGERELG
ncbi:hypothetical protein AAFF_G00150790 [Aldrovandia affinis]|uniref:Uncharacterized protein n=1 Tax=Aldrovandia affinis TaxID=143900 RepID=A0AAD7W8W6_9TELE|nr:hypothetical protein AAFF_G00150790 [Aldrovandia affinis]